MVIQWIKYFSIGNSCAIENKSARYVYNPVDADELDKNVLKLWIYYCKQAYKSNYKRRKTWIENSIHSVAIVKHCRISQSHTPHGNSKENPQVYIRTQPDTLDSL